MKPTYLGLVEALLQQQDQLAEFVFGEPAQVPTESLISQLDRGWALLSQITAISPTELDHSIPTA